MVAGELSLPSIVLIARSNLFQSSIPDSHECVRSRSEAILDGFLSSQANLAAELSTSACLPVAMHLRPPTSFPIQPYWTSPPSYLSPLNVFRSYVACRPARRAISQTPRSTSRASQIGLAIPGNRPFCHVPHRAPSIVACAKSGRNDLIYAGMVPGIRLLVPGFTGAPPSLHYTPGNTLQLPIRRPRDGTTLTSTVPYSLRESISLLSLVEYAQVRSTPGRRQCDCSDPDSYRVQRVIDGAAARLDILDTAGQEEYSAVREQCMCTGEGFMLVYSVTSRQSFQDIASFRHQILRAKIGDYVPVLLVGNKCDLEAEREVTTLEGQALARSLNCNFVETSAKTRINVENAFDEIVREVQRYDLKMRGCCSDGSSSSSKSDVTYVKEGMDLEDGNEATCCSWCSLM
ncbi:hypothetical protein Purlil1_12834 [Purpureocillium lilacinum]|uniref:Uncharacterized protein n=1 Tax=Purpureocillium lilacinum TaxID=33203 RepID=A0ABR0BFT2_PURLI|nr:hypothetical protein Purlil1_12834 [Purpureocillium lilacinum]